MWDKSLFTPHFETLEHQRLDSIISNFSNIHFCPILLKVASLIFLNFELGFIYVII